MTEGNKQKISGEGVTGFGWLLIVAGGCAAAWSAFAAGQTEAVGFLILAQLLGPAAFLAGWVLIATGVVVNALDQSRRTDRDGPP